MGPQLRSLRPPRGSGSWGRLGRAYASPRRRPLRPYNGEITLRYALLRALSTGSGILAVVGSYLAPSPLMAPTRSGLPGPDYIAASSRGHRAGVMANRVGIDTKSPANSDKILGAVPTHRPFTTQRNCLSRHHISPPNHPPPIQLRPIESTRSQYGRYRENGISLQRRPTWG